MDVDEALGMVEGHPATMVERALAAEVRRLRAGEQRVRALHRRQPHYPYCEICPADEGWPCPTVAAFDGEPS